MLETPKYSIKKKKKKRKTQKMIKNIYVKFALKIGSFFGKVIVRYKN